MSMLNPLKHVIVVGGGLAGLTAAISARTAGARVSLFDKEKRVGGNSAKACSGINAAVSHHQTAQNISDSKHLFLLDSINSGKGLSNESLLKILTMGSEDAILFLEEFGLKLDHISKCGGHSAKRTHRESPRPDGKPVSIGWDIISTLQSHISKNIPSYNPKSPNSPSIDIKTDSKVIELLTSPDKLKVIGIRYQLPDNSTAEIFADSVILATGGYGSNPTLLKTYTPTYQNLPTTNGPQTTGDGISLCQPLNASLIDMDQVQIHPTGFVDPQNPLKKTKILAAEALRAYGGLLLDMAGRRFINELDTRDKVTKAIFDLKIDQPDDGDNAVWLLLSDKGADEFGKSEIGFYEKMGLLKRYDGGISDFCKTNGLKLEILSKELDLVSGSIDKFGKEWIDFCKDEPVYAGKVTPVVHYSMGGLKINEFGQVLKLDNEGVDVPIDSLYAVGEVSGGVHGGNRLAGNSLLECVVFGRICGRQAAL